MSADRDEPEVADANPTQMPRSGNWIYPTWVCRDLMAPREEHEIAKTHGSARPQLLIDVRISIAFSAVRSQEQPWTSF
jgi:hypothetical protein